jgi:hypothetical protein
MSLAERRQGRGEYLSRFFSLGFLGGGVVSLFSSREMSSAEIPG